MWLRISSLLMVMMQCGSPANLAQKLDPQASVTKYVNGAGGGQGVIFEVGFAEPLEGAEFQHFIVNGDTLEVAVRRVDPFAIEASRHYSTFDPREGEESPLRPKTPLFDTLDYRGQLVFEVGGEMHEIIITEFKLMPSPLYE